MPSNALQCPPSAPACSVPRRAASLAAGYPGITNERGWVLVQLCWCGCLPLVLVPILGAWCALSFFAAVAVGRPLCGPDGPVRPLPPQAAALVPSLRQCCAPSCRTGVLTPAFCVRPRLSAVGRPIRVRWLTACKGMRIYSPRRAMRWPWRHSRACLWRPHSCCRA
jgi:hypothetical protein